MEAALGVLARRPEAIISIDVVPETRGALAKLLAHAERARVPVRELSGEAMTRVAGGLHHEGVCLTVRPRPPLSVRALIELLHAGPGRAAGAGLALDNVGNPHNLGAILRSAAYFGARALLLSEADGQARLGPAAERVAEGGAEYVAIARAPTLAPTLAALHGSGIEIVGADARAGEPLAGRAFARPCLVVLGNERHGLSAEVLAVCDRLVAIPGTGAIDSLNVSVAAGILLAALAR